MIVEDPHDEQHGIGAGRPGRAKLHRVDDEVLAQQRQLDRRPDGAQVLEAPAEKLGLGQHRDGRGATHRIATRQVDRVIRFL